jgi:Threonyl and Alanyl tRNA synthetase second additional domain./tRNA synthetases class II (A).
MTEKLYYISPEQYQWEAKIIRKEEKKGYWHVELDRTNFYPGGGGQPRDAGTIGGINVMDMYQEGDRIIHVLKEEPPSSTVLCQIDKRLRKEHSQLHSGQHLLSAVCFELFRWKTLSCHIGQTSTTIDLDTPDMKPEQLKRIEDRVNELIFENRKIHIFTIDRREADQYPLDNIPPGHTRLRIVEIEGVEYNACGGTHVRSTAEIGLLKIMKTERSRGGLRVYFVCGWRLYDDYLKKHELLARLGERFSSDIEQIEDRFEKILEEKRETERECQYWFETSARLLTDEWSRNGLTSACHEFEQLTAKEAAFLAKTWSMNGGKNALFASKENHRLYLYSSVSSFHPGQFVKEEASRYLGKGGGNGKTAQVIFPDSTHLRQAFDAWKEKIGDFH